MTYGWNNYTLVIKPGQVRFEYLPFFKLRLWLRFILGTARGSLGSGLASGLGSALGSVLALGSG